MYPTGAPIYLRMSLSADYVHVYLDEGADIIFQHQEIL